jgi:hypothetical protein
MKFKVKEIIGPNTVIGDTGKGLVRARVAVNNRPKVGDSCERPDSECSKHTPAEKPEEAKPEPSKPEPKTQ